MKICQTSSEQGGIKFAGNGWETILPNKFGNGINEIKIIDEGEQSIPDYYSKIGSVFSQRFHLLRKDTGKRRTDKSEELNGTYDVYAMETPLSNGKIIIVKIKNQGEE